jgi:hypothetical protein
MSVTSQITTRVEADGVERLGNIVLTFYVSGIKISMEINAKSTTAKEWHQLLSGSELTVNCSCGFISMKSNGSKITFSIVSGCGLIDVEIPVESCQSAIHAIVESIRFMDAKSSSNNQVLELVNRIEVIKLGQLATITNPTVNEMVSLSKHFRSMKMDK